jgi:chromosome segregation ATPase
MNRLPDNPTKADELAHWQAFRAQLPPCSYLALYLAESDDTLRYAMANDESCDLIATIRKERSRALEDCAVVRNELTALRMERDKAQNEYRQLARALCTLRDELRDSANAAQSLAMSAMAAHARAVQSVVKMQAA